MRRQCVIARPDPMTNLERYVTDVVVIGAGAAGMVAALEAREKGLEVLLIGKGSTGKGTCTSLAGGMFGAPSDRFTPEEHCRATLTAGRGINDPARVELVVSRARQCLEKLVRLGVPLVEVPRGFAVDNRGNRREIPGIPLVDSLSEILAERGVKALPGFHCFDIVTAEGRAAGLLGLTAQGKPAAVFAPAVVLATGGAGDAYARNDNPRGITGDGYGMALRAGCQLQDMEFVQFYPVGIAEPGLAPFLVYPPYASEAKLFDAAGREVLQELEGCSDLNDAIIRFRDTASLLFYRRHSAGGLFLDLTAVGEESWANLYSYRLLARTGFDFRQKRLRVAPITHFFMGGVVVDERGETSVPGLFAAGEVAGGFHGANRMGGNALTECAVCGAIAGASAADHARKERPAALSEGGFAQRIPNWALGRESAVRREYSELMAQIRNTAWEHAGVIRTGKGMEEGLRIISRLDGELRSLNPRGAGEARRHEQARSALLAVRCILEAGLRRRESRGAFFREDYPSPDDARWRRNVRVSLDTATGGLAVDDAPIAGA